MKINNLVFALKICLCIMEVVVGTALMVSGVILKVEHVNLALKIVWDAKMEIIAIGAKMDI